MAGHLAERQAVCTGRRLLVAHLIGLTIVLVAELQPAYGASRPIHAFKPIKGDVCYKHVPKHGRTYYNCRPKPKPQKRSAGSTTPSRPTATTVAGTPPTSAIVSSPSTPTTTNSPSGASFTVTPSSQWAGYISSGGATISATGSWTVAKLSCAASTALGSTWLGVGGWDGSALLQIGTYDQCIGGQEQHGGFVEEFPGTEANLPLVFSPGDTVSVSLNQVTPGTWSFSMTDQQTGQSIAGTAPDGGGGGASWMTEAFGSSGGIPLPVGDGTTFTGLTVNGVPASPNQGLSMPHATPGDPANGYRIAYG